MLQNGFKMIKTNGGLTYPTPTPHTNDLTIMKISDPDYNSTNKVTKFEKKL
jgi:hypothetical protein